MKNIFPGLLGNTAIKELAGKDILCGLNSHAYIIDGPAGSGKHTAAMQMAAALLCVAKNDENLPLPCGTCKSCKKIASGYSTCIEYLNRGDAATLQVEQVRNMLSGISYLPEDGDYKIYIIEEAEKMTPAAQNSLLLTLEEPPAHVVFILLTADSGALLETIRSRAHILKTEIFSTSFIYNTLVKMKQDGKIKSNTDEKLKNAAAAAVGCLGTAFAAAEARETDMHLKLRKTADELVKNLVCTSAAESIKFCRELKLTRQESGLIFYLAMSAVRDLIVIKSRSDELIFYTDRADAEKLAAKPALSRLTDIYYLLSAADDDICRKNASINTVLTTLAVSAWAI